MTDRTDGLVMSKTYESIDLEGRDDYGRFMELQIAGVTQRFRWIEPGAFLMGSPESEPAREDNETQHAVTLTCGFWLADTACTQALWEVVMGKNPSGFRGGAAHGRWSK